MQAPPRIGSELHDATEEDQPMHHNDDVHAVEEPEREEHDPVVLEIL